MSLCCGVGSLLVCWFVGLLCRWVVVLLVCWFVWFCCVVAWLVCSALLVFSLCCSVASAVSRFAVCVFVCFLLVVVVASTCSVVVRGVAALVCRCAVRLFL